MLLRSSNQSRSQSPHYRNPKERETRDKAFRHDMRSKTGSPVIRSWWNALSQSISLPVPLLDKGNEDSVNEIEFKHKQRSPY